MMMMFGLRMVLMTMLMMMMMMMMMMMIVWFEDGVTNALPSEASRSLTQPP